MPVEPWPEFRIRTCTVVSRSSRRLLFSDLELFDAIRMKQRDKDLPQGRMPRYMYLREGTPPLFPSCLSLNLTIGFYTDDGLRHAVRPDGLMGKQVMNW